MKSGKLDFNRSQTFGVRVAWKLSTINFLKQDKHVPRYFHKTVTKLKNTATSAPKRC